jgi:probable rRNA maturation factor
MSAGQPTVEVQVAVTAAGVPDAATIRDWVRRALPEEHRDAELTVRIVDAAEITSLNRDYRGKDAATNVLSFPYQAMPGVDTALLGDIVICAPVVAEESVTRHRPLQAHWAHMVVHGVLHLLGYDHHDDADARRMEARERELLAGLGFDDPYRD